MVQEASRGTPNRLYNAGSFSLLAEVPELLLSSQRLLHVAVADRMGPPAENRLAIRIAYTPFRQTEYLGWKEFQVDAFFGHGVYLLWPKHSQTHRR